MAQNDERELAQIERLLDTKLNGFMELIRLEMRGTQEKVIESSNALVEHEKQQAIDNERQREALQRVHSRIDALERVDWKRLILTELIKWAVPMSLILIAWLLFANPFKEFVLKSIGG